MGDCQGALYAGKVGAVEIIVMSELQTEVRTWGALTSFWELSLENWKRKKKKKENWKPWKDFK